MDGKWFNLCKRFIVYALKKASLKLYQRKTSTKTTVIINRGSDAMK